MSGSYPDEDNCDQNTGGRRECQHRDWEHVEDGGVLVGRVCDVFG